MRTHRWFYYGGKSQNREKRLRFGLLVFVNETVY
jgi:hypothetical protein